MAHIQLFCCALSIVTVIANEKVITNCSKYIASSVDIRTRQDKKRKRIHNRSSPLWCTAFAHWGQCFFEVAQLYSKLKLTPFDGHFSKKLRPNPTQDHLVFFCHTIVWPYSDLLQIFQPTHWQHYQLQGCLDKSKAFKIVIR